MSNQHSTTTGAKVREALDCLLEAIQRVSIKGEVGDVEDLDSARFDAAAALAEQDLSALSLGLFVDSLRWAVDFIDRRHKFGDERPVNGGDEEDDWMEHAAALDLLKDADAADLRDLAKNLGDGEQGEAVRALEQISAIRESIVAHQNINWSAHIYPLVAVLGQAGIDTPDIDFEDMTATYLADSNTHRGVDAYTKLGIVLEERGLRPENNPLLRANCECAHKRASHRNVVGDTRCEVDGCACTRMRARASS